MPTAKRPTIGFLLASLHTGASQALLPGLLDAAEQLDANFICFPGGRLRDSEAFEDQRNVIYDLVGGDCLDGLVTWASSLGGVAGPREISLFHQRFQPLPTVSLSRMLDGVPTVSVDGYRGMRALLSHLIETHGYRRLAFVRGPEKHNPAQERYRAYLDTLEAYRIPLDPQLVTRPLRWEDGAEAIRMLLDERGLRPGGDFQAVVTISDLMALWALKALQERGFKIPADVVVTGFNNSMEERLATPPLTTVELPFYAQGKRSVELLLTHLAGEAVPALITLPSDLIVRQSCGCPSGMVLQAATPLADAAVEPILPAATARAACLSEMVAATGMAIPQTASWLEPVLDAFWRDVQHVTHAESAGEWVRVLENALDQAMRAQAEIYRWHNVLSALRRYVLPALSCTAVASVETMLAQGHIVISEAVQRAQAYQRWQAERQNEILRQAILALLTAVNLEHIAKVLIEFLPRLGIPGAYLALYENPAESLETAQLILAYSGQARLEVEGGGRRFLARQIVPPDLLPQNRRYSLVVEPLFFQERPLGFIVFEMGMRQGAVYELLRANLSSAIHSAALFQEIEQARQTAEKADRIKTLLLANVSHELRTPLNLITGYTQNALQRPPSASYEIPAALRDDLGHIQGNAEHLMRVINDLLDLSRAEIDELDLALELIDPHPLLRDAFQNMADQCALPEVTWRLQLPARLPLVRADALRLRQIMFNLLSNAAKFTEQGEITVGVAIEPPHLHLWVADSGPGIALEQQERIFEPFVTSDGRSGEPRLRRAEGIGLGLSITRHLVMLHGGSMKVDSQPGQGSTFHVYIPLPALGQSRPGGGVQASPVLLLISHAHQPAQELIELTQRQGLKIVSLGALDDLEFTLAGVQPAALAWDLSEARPDDWGLIRRLRHYPGLGQVPFILYGQTLNGESESPTLTIGLTSILSKPSDDQSLLDAMLALCPAESIHPILIVDDDAQVRESHRAVVESSLPACPIRTAADGEAALVLMAAETPALVLLDLMMPGLSGFDVLDQMRADPRLRGVPVIILSNKLLTLDDLKRLEAYARVTYQSKGLWSDTEIAAALHRALFGDEVLPPHTSALVKRAVTYLNENYARSLSRWEIAETVGVSEDYLSRVFSRELGLTPWDYLNRYRVLQARQLLHHTSDSVGAIARQVGFKDQAYFSRVFHKLSGISPQGYRDAQENPAT
jgi:signal transduction histidine kinase/DNA-binding LacI/PurR family transcriptional regulator/AraC-like DNA-binding protein/CheY-like chemotaxis protein